MPMAAPEPSRRFLWALAALGSLAIGAVILFAIVVIDDATRAPSSFGGGVPFAPMAAAVMIPVIAFGACVGMAVVPRSVAERGRSRELAAAVALTCLTVVLLLPSALFCFTAPIGLVALLAAVALFVRIRRP